MYDNIGLNCLITAPQLRQNKQNYGIFLFAETKKRTEK